MSDVRVVVTAEALGGVLGALASRSGPLPKYLYPSAGTLYPVQTYVLVPEGGVEGLVAGVFYYDPDHHALARVAERVTAPNCTILLVEEPAAIEPIYGETAAAFCQLEAGYMAEALGEAAREAGLGLRPVTEISEFTGCPGLSPGNILLSGWICEPAAPAASPQAIQHRTSA